MLSSLWRLDGIPGARTIRHNLRAVAPIKSVAERGRRMWGEFNVEDNCGKSRPPTTVRIEVDLVKRKVTVLWELLQIKKEVTFALEHQSDSDGRDVFCAAQAVIASLEQGDPPFRFVDRDTVEVWQILNDGDPRLLATAAVSVTPLLCSECANDGPLPN